MESPLSYLLSGVKTFFAWICSLSDVLSSRYSFVSSSSYICEIWPNHILTIILLSDSTSHLHVPQNACQDQQFTLSLLPYKCRSCGRSMLHKTAKVEFQPLGVVGAIVSWNYPFHNIFNPMLAAVFSGNSIVIKVFSLFLYRYFHAAYPLLIHPINIIFPAHNADFSF